MDMHERRLKMNKNNDNFYEYLKNNEFKFRNSKTALIRHVIFSKYLLFRL